MDGVEARASENFVKISWKKETPAEEYVEGYRISYAVSSDKPDWIEPPYLREISPSNEIDIYHLAPDTPYVVRVEAYNVAGSSRPVLVSFGTAGAKRSFFNGVIGTLRKGKITTYSLF